MQSQALCCLSWSVGRSSIHIIQDLYSSISVTDDIDWCKNEIKHALIKMINVTMTYEIILPVTPLSSLLESLTDWSIAINDVILSSSTSCLSSISTVKISIK